MWRSDRFNSIILCVLPNPLQVCTVLLAVEPPLVRLGDTDVGRVKTTDVLVRNLSELQARVQLK